MITYHQQTTESREQSRYPWSDATSLRTDRGFVVPRETIADASLQLQGPSRLASVTVEESSIRLGLSSATMVGEAVVMADDELAEVHDRDGCRCGLLVLGEALPDLFGWPPGKHALAGGEFVAAVCSPAAERHVTKLKTADGTTHHGEVWLVGDRGVSLELTDTGDLTISIVGEPLFRRLLCDGDADFVTPVPLRTINGINADAYRSFHLVVGRAISGRPALRVVSEPDGLSIGMAVAGCR